MKYVSSLLILCFMAMGLASTAQKHEDRMRERIRERIQPKIEERLKQKDQSRFKDSEERERIIKREVDREYEKYIKQYKEQEKIWTARLEQRDEEIRVRQKARYMEKYEHRRAELVKRHVIEEEQHTGNKDLLTEKEILIELYNSTNGDNWYNNTNWLTDEPLDTWYGIDMLLGENVSSIDLNDNNLIGSLPESITQLEWLMYLDLGSNSLSGSIPVSFGDLSFGLYHLDLSLNDFSGSLPESFWQLTGLEYLNLAENNFSGMISSEIINFQYLINLNLGSNEFAGALPEQIWQLNALEFLELSYNYFTGEISSDIGNLTNLIALSLYLNEFSGELPSTLENLINLEILSLPFNEFSGELPPTLKNIEGLWYVSMEFNNFSGIFPESLLQINNLWSLGLSYNLFNGSIPDNIGDMSNLYYLSLACNNFSGFIPESLGQLQTIEWIDLSHNYLEGTLPASLTELEYIYYLDMRDNFLDSIPSDFIVLNSEIWLPIYENIMTFEDINNYTDVTLAFPQKEIPLNTVIKITSTDPVFYQLPFDKDIINNTYTWYRDGQYYETNTDGSLEISEALNGHSHIYYAKIENSDYPGEAIYTEDLQVLTESDCGYFMDFDITGSSCDDAQLLDWTESENEIVYWHWNFDDPDSDENNTSEEQNPHHIFISNKTKFDVELIVEDDQQCRDTLVKNIEPHYPITSISGTITYGEDNPITQGYVLIYLLSNGVISTKVDSIDIPEEGHGRYKTRQIPACVDYIIIAYANQDDYPGTVPGWHENATYWHNATPISPDWEQPYISNIDIDLYEINTTVPGESSVSGGIYYIDKKGEPVKNVDITLEFASPDIREGEIIDYEPSGQLGEYHFDGLGTGIFSVKVKVDIPGLRMFGVHTVEITEPNTHLTDLNYYVDINGGIYTSNYVPIDQYTSANSQINIFPNPNNGQFVLQISNFPAGSAANNRHIEIWDSKGCVVHTIKVSEEGNDFVLEINLNETASGVYFVKLISSDFVAVKKLLIRK